MLVMQIEDDFSTVVPPLFEAEKNLPPLSDTGHEWSDILSF
jgi:hypothetical protein